jgi:hypothetical protein
VLAVGREEGKGGSDGITRHLVEWQAGMDIVKFQKWFVDEFVWNQFH